MVAYELDGRRLDHFPTDAFVLERCRPVYETLPGWRQHVSEARRLADLPSAARGYVDRLAELLDCLLQLSLPHKGIAEVVVRPEIIGLESHGDVVFGDRLVEPAQIAQRIAQLVVSIGIARLEANGNAILADRLVVLALCHQGVA